MTVETPKGKAPGCRGQTALEYLLIVTGIIVIVIVVILLVQSSTIIGPQHQIINNLNAINPARR